MKHLLIFMACMMLDAIVPASCQSEEYRKHRFDNWTTGEDSIDSLATADSAEVVGVEQTECVDAESSIVVNP